ncbi:unnamed protein product, partial [Ectocarpus sp. 4 AP-2014]
RHNVFHFFVFTGISKNKGLLRSLITRQTRDTGPCLHSETYEADPSVTVKPPVKKTRISFALDLWILLSPQQRTNTITGVSMVDARPGAGGNMSFSCSPQAGSV